MAESGDEELGWSEEHDCVPLKLRLKTLLANKRVKPSLSPSDFVKNEDQQCDLQKQKGHAMKVSISSCFALKEGNQKLPKGESHDGLSGELSSADTEKNELMNSNEIKVNEVGGTVMEEKVDPYLSTLPSCTVMLKCSGKEEIKYEDNNLRDPMENGIECSLVSVGQVPKTETEIDDDFLDDLDHIVLKERRRLLLSRKVLELTKPASEGKYASLSNQAGSDVIEDNHGREKKENPFSQAESSSGEHHDVPKGNSHDFCKISKAASSTGNIMVIEKSNKMCSSEKASTINESGIEQDSVSGAPDNLFGSLLPEVTSNVKAEPLEYHGVLGQDMGVGCTFVSNLTSVKSEFPNDSYGDKVDHMFLSDRINLLASKETGSVSRDFGSSKKIMPSVLDCSPIASDFTPSLKINRPRKRRRTVTDSIETAMEEDAPGLLKVLIDKGVSVSEIKLYGVGENDEAPVDSLEESFSELETVISKLFFQRQSFMKLGPMRCMKGEKPSYCLACLISLVEQARYLQFRKWPVEWGWCRDLQSFIFVFERHHRIVLERPEYGYATYFFELVDSLTINWQIKRLLTAMKLSSCGRITLIENRALLVGEDLTEGEARVLMEYGWTPNSGLGTILNYRDRVVHDRKNESDSSEWKSKIAKLLMDGYNGGTFVSHEIPRKVVEFGSAEDLQVKMEI